MNFRTGRLSFPSVVSSTAAGVSLLRSVMPTITLLTNSTYSLVLDSQATITIVSPAPALIPIRMSGVEVSRWDKS